jgi:putative Mg2+ transporter-C (MgtC) family protein
MDHASIPLGFFDIMGRLSLAAIAGAVIGVDRELHRKPAGLRTHALVALGASLFCVLGLLLAADPTLDLSAPGRIVQGIVSGVGFIGAGAIFRRGERAMGHGLTTAATIWMVAAIGTAAGAGLWRTTLGATVVAMVLLLLGDPVDRLLQRKSADGRAKREPTREPGAGPAAN